MRKSIIVLLSFVFTYSVAKAQLRVSASINYGNYAMKDLKSLQSDFLRQLSPIPVRSTDKFPPFPGFEGSIVWVSSSTGYGVEAGYNSTGARIAYSDFSGKLLFDQFVYAPKVGLTSFIILNDEQQIWEASFSASAGILFNSYRLQLNTTLNGVPVDSEVIKFKSTNFYFLISPSITRHVKSAFFTIRFGYQVDYAGSLALSTNNSLKLLASSGEEARADWRGVRIAAAVGLTLPESWFKDDD